MTITRAIAAAAMLVGLAVGAASTAWADPPTMNGHYIKTSTGPDAPTTTDDWYATPCGNGCASISNLWGDLGQAHLVNGQWTLDATRQALCSDGSQVPSALSAHYTWDPNTLAGTAQITNKVPACGNPAGSQRTNNIQLTQATLRSWPQETWCGRNSHYC
jgi:hypothetical protein